MSDIATRVKEIIVDKLGVDESEVTPEASFTNDLGADSLDTVELIMEFEKEFNIGIPAHLQCLGQEGHFYCLSIHIPPLACVVEQYKLIHRTFSSVMQRDEEM